MSTNDHTGSTGSHPVGPTQKKRPWWLLLLLVLAAVIVLLLILSRCGGDDASDTVGSSTPAAPTGTTETSPSTTSVPSPSSTSTSSAGSPAPSVTPSAADTSATSGAPAASASASEAPSGPGELEVGATTLLPVSGDTPAGDLTDLTGQDATARAVQVLSVPADEGFWVGSSDTDRIWVQLTGSGESVYQVKVGDLVDFTGTVVAHKKSFAERVGVDTAEGADQLTQQMAHIRADRSSVHLSGQ